MNVEASYITNLQKESDFFVNTHSKITSAKDGISQKCSSPLSKRRNIDAIALSLLNKLDGLN